MAEYADYCDPAWPPGTVKLAQLLGTDKKDAEIILQPRPTDNPNDPLVSDTTQRLFAVESCLFPSILRETKAAASRTMSFERQRPSR